MGSHRGDNTRCCHICGEGFIIPEDLSNHYKNSHPGVKQHQCDICGKEFNNRMSLVKHKRIHDPKRPFPCNFCQARFWKKNEMEYHMKTHTGETLFSCDICDMTYKYISCYNRHLRYDHQISLAKNKDKKETN